MHSYEAPYDFEQQKGSTAEKYNLSAIEGKELWLLRVPDNVSLKSLEGLTIKHPKSAHNGVVGKIASEAGKYKVISSANGSAGEFKAMAEMNLLVPDDDEDAEKSLLTLLPGKCTEMLSVVEDIAIPDSVELAQEILARGPSARAQPENMKLQFIPYGFYSAEEYEALANGKQNDIEMPDDAALIPSTPKKRKKAKTADTPGDTMEVDSKETEKKPKKDKKPKTDKKDKKEKKEKKEKKSKKSKE
ncbi:hypothetical protein IWW50_000036 [Coemansia erecta]|nr:hypothetical protein IWW50_000036 [Coemansia erecta]